MAASEEEGVDDSFVVARLGAAKFGLGLNSVAMGILLSRNGMAGRERAGGV